MARYTAYKQGNAGGQLIAMAITLILLAAIGYIAYEIILHYWNQFISPSNNFSGSNPNLTTTIVSSFNQTASNLSLDNYMLSLINKDRQKYGLTNVTLSIEPSGQQHAQSMFEYDYFSHWDIYGMKPYMRYTLFGGTGAVDENIAYYHSSECTALGCTGTVNPRVDLQKMEYSMMYNDSLCCNNGHRDNILDPEHNQVSIGIAYNASKIYLVEDFIDNYITWNANSYGFDPSNNEMYLFGTLQNGYALSSITIGFDAPVQNMSVAQLNNTSSYSYGNQIAGVVSSPNTYYNGISTIVADKYLINGDSFKVAFNLHNTVIKNGPGEYTVFVWLNGTKGNNFVGSTYTIFIGKNDTAYVPNKI